MKLVPLLSAMALGLSSAMAADAVVVDGSGTLNTTNIVISRTTPAAATEAVRGDDPRLTRLAGAGTDGAFVDATTAPTGAGYFDYSSITLTTAKTMPAISIVRVAGNITLSSTLAISTVASDTDQASYEHVFNAGVGRNGNDDTRGSGGGGHVGAGGSGDGELAMIAGGAALAIPTGASRNWLALRPLIGGRSGNVTSAALSGRGGGSLILIVEGNIDMTGGTIAANGGNGGTASNDHAGGGGGGSLIVICTGTITAGTFTATGGAGANGSGEDGGGGGGGYVALVANAYAGTQTTTVTGGSGPDTATDGGAGTAVKITMPTADIRAMLAR